MCSTGLTSCHQNLLGGAGHQKGSNPEGEFRDTLEDGQMDEEVTRITLTLAIAISRFVLILFEDGTKHCFDCDSKKKSATFPRVLN